MKLEGGKEIGDFSLDLAIALSDNFHIQEQVWECREYVSTYVEIDKISDFIQQFIGDRL